MPKVRYDMVGVWVLRRGAGGWEHLQLRRAAGDYMGGTWSLCRGGVEAGETAMDTALRELREETGLAPVELYRLATLEQFYTSAGDTVWHVPFFAAVVGAEASVVLNAEHDAARWVGEGEVESALVWPGELRLLEEVRRFVCGGHPTLKLMRVG